MWNEHSGSRERPVADGAIVEIERRDGSVETGPAGWWHSKHDYQNSWKHDGSNCEVGTMASRAKITDTEDTVLSIMHDHGPMRFTTAADITACERLYRDGYISEYGDHHHKALTPKGLRYIQRT